MTEPGIEVTPALVRRSVREMAPLVAHFTGWRLNTEALGVRLVARENAYEDIAEARLRHAGLAVDRSGPRTFLEALEVQLMRESILGAYEPGSRELLLVRENVASSNLDGLRLVVSHELVHFGQHGRYGFLFDRIDAILRDTALLALEARPGSDQAAAGELSKLQGIMGLLESHAAYVEKSIRRLYLPRAQVATHFNIATLLFQVLGAQKVAQYTDRLPQVEAATAAGAIDALYLGAV